MTRDYSPSVSVAGADETGQCYKALGFSPGFAPDADVSPYLKLLPMLAGIGSPGTIQEVCLASPHDSPGIVVSREQERMEYIASIGKASPKPAAEAAPRPKQAARLLASAAVPYIEQGLAGVRGCMGEGKAKAVCQTDQLSPEPAIAMHNTRPLTDQVRSCCLAIPVALDSRC